MSPARFTLPKVEFMPGAFAYHLHSFSATTLRSASQGWCGPLLAKGATCTMGCVYEPYLTSRRTLPPFWRVQPAANSPLARPLGRATGAFVADHRHR